MRLQSMARPATRTWAPAGALVRSILISAVAAAAHATESPVGLPPQPLVDALEAFSRQTGFQLLYKAGLANGVTSLGAPAGLNAEDTLSALLRDTGLTFAFVNERTITILQGAQEVQPVEDPPQASDPLMRDLGQVLVKGWPEYDQRHLHHEAQPYSVITRDEIERSGATNLGQVLQRLTMNAQGPSEGLFGGPLGDRPSINLRGLGADDTLILINGRRATCAVVQGQPVQADVNGIPLLAIDKVEVLPMTASGVYGGSATGGVVNVILRSDYTGLEAAITHNSDFSQASATDIVNLVYGSPLWGERASFMVALTGSEADTLRVEDRDLVQRGQDAILANNPQFYFDSPIPPLGATPNFRTVDGSPLSASVSEPFGFVPESYAGGGDLTALQAHAGQYNLALPYSAQATGLRRSLTTATRSTGALANFHWSMTRNVEAYVQGLTSRREGEYQFNGASSSTFVVPATVTSNPFGKPLLATIPLAAADGVIDSDVRNYRLSTGLTAHRPGDWRLGFDFTWGRFTARHTDPLSLDYGAAAAAVESGELDVLRDLRRFPVDFSPYLVTFTDTPYDCTSWDARFWIQGKFQTFLAEDVELAAMLDRQTEEFAPSGQFRADTFSSVFPGKSLDVNSFYIETRWPLTRKLKLIAAARYDDYQILGAPAVADPLVPVTSERTSVDALNPTISLQYRVVPSFLARASFSTGFRPPDTTQLVPTTDGGLPFGVLGFVGLVDPRRGHTPVTTGSYLDGGNPDLRPEQSESWSIGFEWSPGLVQGMGIALDYTRIRKTDDIATFPAGAQRLLDRESEFPHRVVRAPRDPGDPAGWAGPLIRLDNTLMNIASAEIEALDVKVEYRGPETHLGQIELHAALSWQPHLTTQALSGYPLVENVGLTVNNPTELKGSAGLIWSHGNWEAGPSVRYFGSYVASTNPVIQLNQGSSRVPDQLYVDAFVSYRLAGMEAQLIVQNVLDKRPPFDAGSPLLYSGFADPRLATYAITLRKRFGSGAAR